MAQAHVYVCEHTESTPAPFNTYGADTASCPARTRAATTDRVLREVAVRDGWSITDGLHLCPFHAAEATTS